MRSRFNIILSQRSLQSVVYAEFNFLWQTFVPALENSSRLHSDTS